MNLSFEGNEESKKMFMQDDFQEHKSEEGLPEDKRIVIFTGQAIES